MQLFHSFFQVRVIKIFSFHSSYFDVYMIRVIMSLSYCSSEDEFTVPNLSREAHIEITQQLIKDGYNLDLVPDDEDLDLIPPRPLNERCMCCPSSTILSGFSSTTCIIQ